MVKELEDVSIPVKQWGELREFLAVHAMGTEFGLINLVVAGQLASALFVTAFTLTLVLPQKDVTKIVLGIKAFACFAMMRDNLA